MFGLGDFWVSSVFVLMALSTILCVVYGAINWNNDGADDEVLQEEEKKWEEDEKDMEEKL